MERIHLQDVKAHGAYIGVNEKGYIYKLRNAFYAIGKNGLCKLDNFTGIDLVTV